MPMKINPTSLPMTCITTLAMTTTQTPDCSCSATVVFGILQPVVLDPRPLQQSPFEVGVSLMPPRLPPWEEALQFRCCQTVNSKTKIKLVFPTRFPSSPLLASHASALNPEAQLCLQHPSHHITSDTPYTRSLSTTTLLTAGAAFIRNTG